MRPLFSLKNLIFISLGLISIIPVILYVLKLNGFTSNDTTASIILFTVLFPLGIGLQATSKLNEILGTSQKYLRQSESRRLSAIIALKRKQIIAHGFVICLIQVLCLITFFIVNEERFPLTKVICLYISIGCSVATIFSFLPSIHIINSEIAQYIAKLESRESQRKRKDEFIKKFNSSKDAS